MNKTLLLALTALPVLLSSCATSQPPQAYHNTDNAALIVQSLDNRCCQVVAPTILPKEENSLVLDQAKTFSQRQTAVIILESLKERDETNKNARAAIV